MTDTLVLGIFAIIATLIAGYGGAHFGAKTSIRLIEASENRKQANENEARRQRIIELSRFTIDRISFEKGYFETENEEIGRMGVLKTFMNAVTHPLIDKSILHLISENIAGGLLLQQDILSKLGECHVYFDIYQELIRRRNDLVKGNANQPPPARLQQENTAVSTAALDAITRFEELVAIVEAARP